MTGPRSRNSDPANAEVASQVTQDSAAMSVWRKPTTWLAFMVVAAVLVGVLDWARSKRSGSAPESFAASNQEGAVGFPYVKGPGYGVEVEAQVAIPVLLRFPGVDGYEVEESLSNQLVSGIDEQTVMRMAVLCIIADSWLNGGSLGADSIDVHGAFGDPWGVLAGPTLGTSADATVLVFRNALRKAAWAAEEIQRRDQELDWTLIDTEWAKYQQR